MQSYPTDESVVRREDMNEVFTKFHLNNGQVLHRFTQSDAEEPPHDHPFNFTSHILSGGYVEEVFTVHPDGTHSIERVERKPGTSHRVLATTIHRLVDLPTGECLTLIEPGPLERVSGFYSFLPEGNFRRNWDGDWQSFSAQE